MYFKEKEDTNIDKEFETNKKSGFSLKDIPAKYYIIIGVTLIAIAITIIVISLLTGSKNTIELIGEEKIIITKDSDYIEPGYKAYDKKKNDMISLTDAVSFMVPYATVYTILWFIIILGFYIIGIPVGIGTVVML